MLEFHWKGKKRRAGSDRKEFTSFCQKGWTSFLCLSLCPSPVCRDWTRWWWWQRWWAGSEPGWMLACSGCWQTPHVYQRRWQRRWPGSMCSFPPGRRRGDTGETHLRWWTWDTLTPPGWPSELLWVGKLGNSMAAWEGTVALYKRLLHQDSCDHGSMLTRTQFTVPEGSHVVYSPTKVTSWKTGLQHGGQVLP